MRRILVGLLLLGIALCLVYTAFVLPGKSEIESLFSGGKNLTAVTLRQLQGSKEQIGSIERSTKVLADTTVVVADSIPIEVSFPWPIGTRSIPGAASLRKNADAIATTAVGVHETAENLQSDIPALIEGVQQVDRALQVVERRTAHAMQATQFLIWLAAAVIAVHGGSLILSRRGSTLRLTDDSVAAEA